MMRTGAILFWIIVRFVSAMDNNEFLDLTTPVKNLGEGCGYERCPPIRPDALNVHVVPHTHLELGYDKVFEDHFTGENEFKFRTSPVSMKRILDAVVTELWENEQRTFTFTDLPFFFHWWSKRDPTVRRMVYTLVRQGRFNFAGGGWSTSDEATTNYQMLIDSYTYGLRKLNATFTKCGRPLVAWQAHAAGHSKEFASLIALMGYDALFISPISFDDELNRMGNASLEFIWRGNDDLGIETDVFTHSLFDGFDSPPGFCFSSLCSDALVIVSDKTFTNVAERVSSFLTATVHRQSPYYRTQHIMVMMGGSRAYHDAQMWFRNIERLIEFTNTQAAEKSLAFRTFFSSPACYLKAVHASSPVLPIKQDDFLPLRADNASFATGMYTSRPTIKYMMAEANRYMQIAKQLQILGRLGNNDKTFEEINWVLGVMQDHNIITGASSQYVTDRYNHKLYLAVQRTTLVLKDAINSIRGSTNTIIYYRCDFNISSCHNAYIQSFYIIVYNPLAWPVTMPVRLPVRAGQKITIIDPKDRLVTGSAVTGARVPAPCSPTRLPSVWNKIPSYLMKIPDPVQNIPGRYRAATEEVVFIAEKLPPLGFRSYYFDSERIKVKTKRSIADNPKDKGKDGNLDLETLHRNLREEVGVNNENKDSVTKPQDGISTTAITRAKEQEKEVVNNNLGEDHTKKQFLIYYPDDIETITTKMEQSDMETMATKMERNDIETMTTNIERNEKSIDQYQNKEFLIYYPDDIESTTTNMERNNKSIGQYQETKIFYLDQTDLSHISVTENNQKNYNFGEKLKLKNDSSYDKINFKIQTAKPYPKDENQYNNDKNKYQVTINKRSNFAELKEVYAQEKAKNIQMQTESYNQQEKNSREYNENEKNIFKHEFRENKPKIQKNNKKSGNTELSKNKNIVQTNIIQDYNNIKHETDLNDKKNRTIKDRRQVNTELKIEDYKTTTQVLNQSETIVKNNYIKNNTHRTDMNFLEPTTIPYDEHMLTGVKNSRISTNIDFASLSQEKVTKNNQSHTKKIRTEYVNQLLDKNIIRKDDQLKIQQVEKSYNKTNKNLYYSQTDKPLYKSHLNTQNQKEKSFKIINSRNRPTEEEKYYGINVTLSDDIYTIKRSQSDENELIDSSYEVTDRNAMRHTDTDTEEITFSIESTKQEPFSKSLLIDNTKYLISNHQDTVSKSYIPQNISNKYNKSKHTEKKQTLNKNNQNDDQHKSQDIVNIPKINKEHKAQARNANGVEEKSKNSERQTKQQKKKKKVKNGGVFCDVLEQQAKFSGPQENFENAYIYDILCSKSNENVEEFSATNDETNQQSEELIDNNTNNNQNYSQLIKNYLITKKEQDDKKYKNLKHSEVYEKIHTVITEENKDNEEENMCNVLRKQNNETGSEKVNSRYGNIYDSLCLKNTDNLDMFLPQNDVIKTNETIDTVEQSDIKSNNKEQEEHEDGDYEDILNEYLNKLYFPIRDKAKKNENKTKNKTNKSSEINNSQMNVTNNSKIIETYNRKSIETENIKVNETENIKINASDLSKVNETDAIKTEDHSKVNETDAIKTEDLNKVNETNAIKTEELNKVNETNAIKTEDLNKVNETNAIKIEDLNKVNETDAIQTEKINTSKKKCFTDIITTEQPDFEYDPFSSVEIINYKFKNVEEEIQWYKNLLKDPDLKYDDHEYERRTLYLKQRTKDYNKPGVKISAYRKEIPNDAMFKTLNDKHVDIPSSDTRLNQNKKYKVRTRANILNEYKLIDTKNREEHYRNKDTDQSNLNNFSKSQSNLSQSHNVFKRGDSWIDDPYLRKLAHLPTRRPDTESLKVSDADEDSETEKPKWDPKMIPGYYLREQKRRKGYPVRTTMTEKSIQLPSTPMTTNKPVQRTTTRKQIKYTHRKAQLVPLRSTQSPSAHKAPKRLPPVIMYKTKPIRKPKKAVVYTKYLGIKPTRITKKEFSIDTDEETPSENDVHIAYSSDDNEEAVVTTTEKKVNINVTKIMQEETPSVRRVMVYTDFEPSPQTFIENQYLRLTINQRSRELVHMNLSNGVQISLNIQFFFYEADDPLNTGRDGVRPPGAHIFRTLLNEPKPINDKFTSRVYTNPLVQELHMTFSDWASMALRVYNNSPVVEADWVVGPVPLTEDIGREVFVRYKTSLVNNGVFYTDANGRQMIKRIRNKRPTYETDNVDNVASNIYPVTSKISIRDIHKNIRFSVFNDRSQGGTSLNDGEIDLFLHRRILTVDDDVGGAVLNETQDDEPIRVRGTHYLYLTRANYKPNKLFEKKFAKEIALQPQVLVSGRMPGNKNLWRNFNNEFRGIRNKIPFGIHILTLERVGPGQLLIRLENYLQKSEMISAKPKKVYLKKLLTNIAITSIRETTLAANQYLSEAWTPLQWKRETQFLANFNNFYGTGEAEYNDEEELRPLNDDNEMLKEGIWLEPQQIRSFIAEYEYNTDE